MNMLAQYIIRAALIACGGQWFEIHTMDLVLTRRRRLLWLQLYMVFKTMAGIFFSYYASMVYPGAPVWTAALYLSDLILVIGGYALFVYTFSDDPVFGLGLYPIVEAIAIMCLILVWAVNRIEGRDAFEAMASFHPADLFMPLLCISSFYLLRPLLRRLLFYISHLYRPHRGLQKVILISFTLYTRLPTILDKNLGGSWGILMLLYILVVLAAGIWLVRSDIRTQRQERRLLNMQISLLERRTYLTAQISGEAERIRMEISRQMEQLQETMEQGTQIDSKTLGTYIEKLDALQFEKRRGNYCSDALVDEVLSQIHETSERNGNEAKIHLQGYDLQGIREDDVVQILYDLWSGCNPESGQIEIQITTEGRDLVIRYAADAIDLNRARKAVLRDMAHLYSGRMTIKKTAGRKCVEVRLKTPNA